MKKNLLILLVIIIVAATTFTVGYYFKGSKSLVPLISNQSPSNQNQDSLNQKTIKNVEVNQRFTLKVGEIAKLQYETPGSIISYRVELKSIIGSNGAKVNISVEETALAGGAKLSSWPEKSFTLPELNSDVSYGGLGLDLVTVASGEAVFSSAVVTY